MTAKTHIRARMTPQQIDAIKPSPKRVLISDEVVANLYLRVEPGGAKAWLYNAAPIKGQGRRIKENLGRWPIISLDEARSVAKAHNLRKLAGIDPRVAKASAEAAANNTVDALFNRWIEYKRKAQEAPKALPAYTRQYTNDIKPKYGDMPIASFDKAALRSCLEVMHDRGAVGSANNLLKIMKAFLRWCINEDYIVGHNGLTLAQANRRRSPGARAFSLEELALCWRAVEQFRENVRDAVRLLILTGLRKNEVFHAHASEYHLGIWTLSPDRMKGRREHFMPLGTLGREIFERRTKFRADNLFSDTAYVAMFNKAPAEIGKTMERLSGRKIARWSFHSIRKGVRTALSSDEMDRLGYVLSEDISEIVLGHSLGSLNRRYNKANYGSQIGRALSAWQHLLTIEIDRQERLANDLRKLDENLGHRPEQRQKRGRQEP